MLTRCPACSGKFKPVPASGPEKCWLMCVGERPGETENRKGIPFIGKSGMEWNENYLRLAGLDRDEIYVTNCVKCWEVGNRKPSEKEIRECAAHHLKYEIREVDPQLIILMGASACSLVPSINLETDHGLMQYGKLFDYEGPIVPMYHPASGLHDTGMMIPILEDWERLRSILSGDYQHPEDQYPKPDYRLVETIADFDAYFPYPHSVREIALDTETMQGKPWSVQVSHTPGTAIMWRVGEFSTAEWAAKRLLGKRAGARPDLTNRFRIFMEEVNPVVILHNSPGDLDTMDRMGINTRKLKFRDTMQEAYQLGNLPQGLKELSYRLLGVRMRHYQDVVMPYSRNAVSDWMMGAMALAQSALTVSTFVPYKKPRKDRKTGQILTGKTVTKPSVQEKALERILKHTLKERAPGATEYNPWEKLTESLSKADPAEWRDWDLLIRRIGPIPQPGIEHTPIEEAVAYGCADADMTLRCARRLVEIRKRLVSEGGEWDVYPDDWDK